MHLRKLCHLAVTPGHIVWKPKSNSKPQNRLGHKSFIYKSYPTSLQLHTSGVKTRISLEIP